MKTLKRIAGITIITTLFGFLFIVVAKDMGISGALKVFGLALAIVFLIFIAYWLIADSF